MSVFLLIILGLPLLNLVWWLWADGRLRRLRWAWLWRGLLAAFAGGNLGLYVWFIASRMSGTAAVVPVAFLIECYVWFLVVLPVTILLLGGATTLRVAFSLVSWTLRTVTGRRRADSRSDEVNEGTAVTATSNAASDDATPAETREHLRNDALTRRQILAGALVAAPPLVLGVAQTRATSQLDSFRVRRLEVDIPGLPAGLDGVTIAHVSDLHVGRFTHGAVLDAVVKKTRELQCDLTVFTGDLIDHDLADLPTGIETLQRIAEPRAFFMCEGNHDLFESRQGFENNVRDAGLPLLLNETVMAEVRGQPVEILGLSWGRAGGGRGARTTENMAATLARRQADAFSILLAHHPHAFDCAAGAGVPLTLAGHTHGGQLMLSEQIGAGPLLFKYWSGLYRRGDSRLVVSNGAGNWFPLRINAPAEIVHITLHAIPALLR